VSLFAIGDLHGCPDELEVLLEHIGPSSADTLVFLGDYVDRGPAVRMLMDRLVELRSEPVGTVFLRGNHEDMLLHYLGYRGRHGSVYLANGGGATLRSYGIAQSMSGKSAAAMIPPSHLQFLLDLALSFARDRYLFVHAGIRPGTPLDEQDEEDLLWIREEFFTRNHQLPYTIVYGHTPDREARVQLPYHIGLDTGLVYGNKLSCLDVTNERLLQVQRGGKRVLARDLADAVRGARH
jgi:serine/threonine protein phosphatase 1